MNVLHARECHKLLLLVWKLTFFWSQNLIIPSGQSTNQKQVKMSYFIIKDDIFDHVALFNAKTLVGFDFFRV